MINSNNSPDLEYILLVRNCGLEADTKYTMNKSVKSLIENGMIDILTRANQLNTEQQEHLPRTNVISGEDTATMALLIKELSDFVYKQQGLITDMAKIIQTNSYVQVCPTILCDSWWVN